MGYPLSQRRINASAALLDKREVKSRGICDCLDVVARGKIVVGSRNRWKLPLAQTWNRLWKRERRIEVGIVGAAPAPGPPTGVHRELHEVCESSDLLRARRSATRQSTKLIEIHRVSAFRRQIRVNESEMSNLILGIVVYILRHVFVELLKGSDISCAPAAPRDFAVLNAPEFVVLNP